MSTQREKTCEHCGERFTKNPTMAFKQFERQRFCSKTCGGASKSARKPRCGVSTCERVHRVHGLCDMHYQRLLKRGSLADPQRETPEQRFRRLTEEGSVDDCWEWNGPRTPLGYGRFVVWQGGVSKHWYAHRFAMKLQGVELTDSAVVMHSCDNPPCVNPAHLSVGTQLDNIRDAKAKGRMNLSGLELGRLSNNRKRQESA